MRGGRTLRRMKTGACFEILRVPGALEVKRTENLKVSKDSKKLKGIFKAAARFRLPCRSQRLIEIGNDVVCIFDPRR
jgi:hypothetical protein